MQIEGELMRPGSEIFVEFEAEAFVILPAELIGLEFEIIEFDADLAAARVEVELAVDLDVQHQPIISRLFNLKRTG